MTLAVIVFMERPGTSNVMSAMPSESTSILKFSILPILPGRIRIFAVVLLGLRRRAQRHAQACAKGDAERDAEREIVEGDAKRDANADADADADRQSRALLHQFIRSMTVAVP